MNRNAGTLTLLLLCLSSALAAPTTIQIGGIFYLTGTDGSADSTGLSREAALMAAIANINANPKYNATMVLQASYCDTERSSTRAVDCAVQESLDGADVFITGLTTPETSAILDNTNIDVPTLASGANAPTFSSSATYPRFLRDIPNGTDQTKCLAAVIEELGSGVGVAGVITMNDASTSAIGLSLFERIADHSPAPIYVSMATGYPGDNITNAVKTLNDSGAKIFPISSQANDISKMAAALNYANVVPPYIVAGPDSMLTSSSFAQTGSQAFLQNAFACTLAPPTGNLYQTFLDSYAQVRANQVTNAPETPESKAVYTYDLAYIVAEAVLTIPPTTEITTENLMTAMRAVSFTGASGEISFTAGSNDIAQEKAYVVQKVQGTAFPVIGTYSVNGRLAIDDDDFRAAFPSSSSAIFPAVFLSTILFLAAMLF